jgi:hypothetical protein
MSSTKSGLARSATATVLQIPRGGGGGGGPPDSPDGVVPVNDFGLTPAQVAQQESRR